MGDSAFERFQRPDNVDVADTPFAPQRGLLDVLLNRPQGPQVVDPASLKRDPWVFNGGGTAKKASDLAWDEATTSPAQRQAQRILGSEPLQTVMNWANFAGPGMGRIPKPVMMAEGAGGGGAARYMLRLYRCEGKARDIASGIDWSGGMGDAAKGRWFTTRADEARGTYAGPDGKVYYVDVPNDRMKDLGHSTLFPGEHYILPEDLAASKALLDAEGKSGIRAYHEGK